MCTEEEARADIIDVMGKNPDQATAILSALKEGRVDGDCYYGECACLLGTILRGKVGLEESGRMLTDQDFDGIERACGRMPSADSPAERWFLCIGPGDTPETNGHAAKAHEWIQEWASEKGLLK